MIVGGPRSLILPLLLATGALSGCQSDGLKKAAQSDSLLAIFTTSSPLEAARAMVDPYDPDKRLRGTAMIAAAPFGGEDVYVKIYVDHIQNDSDMGVRAVSARALGLHGKPEHALLIAPLLKSDDRNVRLEAVRALQRLHNPAVVEAIIEASQVQRSAANAKRGEIDMLVRSEACTALGQYAEVRVLNALVDAVDDDSLVVNKAARASLKTLTGQDFGDERKPWVNWLTNNQTPFAGGTPYVYPAFNRDRFWYEYVPFVPPPPNEEAANPAGYVSASPANPAGSR